MNRRIAVFAIVMIAAASAFPQSVAKVIFIEGKAQMLRPGAKEWQDIRPNLSLKVGDQLCTHAESFLEIRYAMGAVLRMDENAKITVEASSEKAVTTRSSVGQVWVNMKKMVATGKEFQVSSPTATAAIRGTVFQMSTTADSTSDVSVFDGKVAVGPSDDLKKQLAQEKKRQARVEEPAEIGGPEEIAGPYEVSLETWMTIVAGQRISVRSDGKFAKEKFDLKVAAQDAFVKRNQELDRKLSQE